MGIPIQVNCDTAAERDDLLAHLQKRYTVIATKQSETHWAIQILRSLPTPMPTPTPTPTPVPVPASLFSDLFDGANGLITNEYAYWNPAATDAKRSADWEMTSGSLFRKDNMGWTGDPDSGTAPNKDSSNANNSCVFRLTSKRKDFGDVKVSFSYVLNAFKAGAATPAVDWDGGHVFLRYQSQYHLYYVSFLRRDEKCVIKKKVPGGTSNSGTYYDISTYVAFPWTLNDLKRVETTAKNLPDGTVELALYVNGSLVVKAIDTNKGGPAITAPGMTGIRGDNANLQFDNFKVEGI